MDREDRCEPCAEEKDDLLSVMFGNGCARMGADIVVMFGALEKSFIIQIAANHTIDVDH